MPQAALYRRALQMEFGDELVKQTETKSISDIENAKKQAELIVSKAEQEITVNRQKAISDLKAKIDSEFKSEESKVKVEANKIISDGELEAEKLKQEIRGRIPQAVEHIIKSIIERVISLWKISDEVARGKAVETIEVEVEELENIFGVLVLGSFIGMPSPPMQISLDLMPLMERELILMMEKVDTANEPIAQLFSVLDIG